MFSTQFYRKHDATPRKRAFSIIEVVLSLIVLMFMVILVAAVIPTSLRNTRYSADFSQAASLVQHKINQFQDAGYSNMSAPSLGQSGLKLVDGTPSTPATNARGAASGTFEFTDTDKLWQYFNGGMDSSGNQLTGATTPQGYIYIAPYTPSAYINTAGATEYGLVRITITIQWWTGKGSMQSFSGTTLVPRAVVN